MGRQRHLLEHGRPHHRWAAAAVGVLAIAVSSTLVVRQTTIERVEAVWTVDGQVGESSQVIPIRAAHPSCPSWSNLGGLVVTAVETEATVTLTATFPEHDDDRPCAWMGNSMRATAKLEAPLGDRLLIDGATGLDPATPAAIAFHTGQSPRD